MKTFKAPKLKVDKSKLCAIVQVAYHALFAGSMVGGGHYYINRLQQMENVAVAQVDRIEAISKDIKATMTGAEADAKKTAAEAQASLVRAQKLEDNALKSLDSVKQELDSVKNACGKIKKPF